MKQNSSTTPPCRLLSGTPKTLARRVLLALTHFLKSYWHLVLCAVIPVVLVYFIYLARGLHPFGDGSVLVLDLNGQYVWFFEALRNFVGGDADLLYSFSRALGGEFLGIFAYYLSSPLSFLVCLFPKDCMLEALLTLFLAKTAIAGWSFGYYMHRTAKHKNPASIIIFAVCYALSAYALVQQHNTMWIDAMMWLPLITLGLEALIKEGKFKLYTIMLAITLFSNFYIGFMVCIYCVLYFFLYYFAHAQDLANNPYREQRHFLKSFARFAFYSVLAAGAAAVILLSAYYSLNFGKTTFSTPDWTWSSKFDLLELFYKFLPDSYDTVRPEGLPFVYCGVLTLLLVPVYFCSKKFSVQRKIASGAFILILIISLSFSVPDLVWHGFQEPNWLNARYSFMLCFFLCTLACRAFEDFSAVSLKAMAAAAAVIAILCLILQNTETGEYINPSDITCIWFTLLLLFGYLAIFGIASRLKSKQMVSAVLVSVVCLEAFACGLWNLNGLDEDVRYTTYSNYNNHLDKLTPIVEKVQSIDSSFYRMEKTITNKLNDNMALGIRGLSGSTSTLNKETIAFLSKMGYQSRTHISKYLGGNPVNDSLLGVKYIISDKSIYKDYYQMAAFDPANRYTAYLNPYALSIAYGVDDDLLDFPLGFSPLPGQDSDRESGMIASLVDSLKDTLNQWLDIDETNANAYYKDEYTSPFDRLNAIVTAMLGEEETVKLFVPIEISETKLQNVSESSYVDHIGYETEIKGKDASVSYVLNIPTDGELFFYMPSNYPREVKLTLIEGTQTKKIGSFASRDTNHIVSLGKQESGDWVTLEMTLEEEKLFSLVGANYFCYLDLTAFEEAMNRLAQDQLEITEFTEHSFAGTLTTSRDNELIMTTIPYDKAWKITVNGQEVEPIKALGSLIAFRIEAAAGNTYTVEMVYSPSPVYVGLTISLISIALLTLLIVFRKKLTRIKLIDMLVAIPVPKDYNPDTQASRDDPALPLPDPPHSDNDPKNGNSADNSD